MLEEKAQEIIDLEGNYQLEKLKFKADPILCNFIMQNAHKVELSDFKKKLQRLYGDQFKKITFFKGNKITEYINYIKDVIISFLCQIDQSETQILIQNIKLQALQSGLNEYKVQKKKSQIRSKQLYQYVAIHFLMYFCKGSFGSIYQFLKKIREKIKYEIQEQGQVFDLVPLPSIDFPISIKNKFQCYCQMGSSPKQRVIQNISDVLHCQQCLSRYHTNCQINVLNCSSCNLSYNSQKSKIKEKLNLFYIFPNKSINAIKFKIPNLQQDQLQPTLKYGIQIRVERVNYKTSKDACSAVFINKYHVVLNGETIKIKPGLLKSGQPIRIPNKYLAKNNILIIKKIFKQSTLMQDIDTSPTFMVGIFKVQKGITSTKPSPITQLQSKAFLKSICTSLNSPYLDVSLIDQNTKLRIQIPVRGKNCKHFNCFDLKGFKNKNKELKNQIQKELQQIKQKQKNSRLQQQSTSDITQSRTSRDSYQNIKLVENLKKSQKNQQICPICQQKITILLLDPLFEQILNSTNLSVTYVQIKHDGNFFINNKVRNDKQNTFILLKSITQQKFKQYKKANSQSIQIQSEPECIEID